MRILPSFSGFTATLAYGAAAYLALSLITTDYPWRLLDRLGGQDETELVEPLAASSGEGRCLVSGMSKARSSLASPFEAGVLDAPLAASRREAILAAGGVVVEYSSALEKKSRTDLRAWARTRTDVVVAPSEHKQPLIVLRSGLRADCDRFDPAEIDTFLAYVPE